MCSFDTVAEGYDETFTHTRLGRWLRGAVWAELAPLVRPGDTVLELGCGTGEDAVWLARRGARVVATDAAPAMLEVARQKAVVAGVTGRVAFAQFDASRGEGTFLPRWEEKFDLVFANFGVLNCLPERRPLAEALALWVRPGGKAVFVVMGPLCPWEIAWHLAHGQMRAAFRRWRGGVEAHVGKGATVRVWYPTPWRLRREFRPHFRHLKSAGIGVLLPPSYLGHLVDRWPRAFERLTEWEKALGAAGAWLGDHYLIAFERVRDYAPSSARRRSSTQRAISGRRSGGGTGRP